MTLFPLDAVRNAAIDLDLELLLEDIREEVASFPFSIEMHGEREDILEAYDMSRPRLNVIAASLRDLRGGHGGDVSTGLGFLPVVLRRCGLHVLATEREPEMGAFAAAADTRILPYVIGAGAPPVEARSLDFLVFAEVLEHLNLPPVRVLRELAALLRPSGRLILTTPNVARLQHVELLAAGENFLEPFSDETPPGRPATDLVEHVREYSVREVVDALEGAGLGVETVVMTGWGKSGYDLLPNPYANEIIVARAIA